MAHVTSERHLFTSEDRMRASMSVACDALLIALQREHPEIVRRLQERSAVGRADPCTD